MNLTANAELLGSPDGNFFAKVAAGSRPEVYALESGAFRGWLIDGYIRACHEVPSDWAIRRVFRRPRGDGALRWRHVVDLHSCWPGRHWPWRPTGLLPGPG